MADLNPTELRKVKLIFQALKEFKQKPSITFTSVDQDGVNINVFRKEALDYLREKLPSLEGLSKKNLENDSFLLDYLTKKTNRGEILKGLAESEKAELYQELAKGETPHPEEESMADTPVEAQAPPEPSGTTGEQANTMASPKPTLPTASSNPRQSPYRVITQAPPARTPRTKWSPGEKINPTTIKTVRKHNLALSPIPYDLVKSIQKAQKGPKVKWDEAENIKSQRIKRTLVSNQPAPSPLSGASRTNLSSIKPPTALTNAAKNLASAASRAFQRNIGKFLTPGRVMAVGGAILGGLTAAGLGGGATMTFFGSVGGAIGGSATPSWFRSGGGGRFFNNLGNNAANAFSRLSSQATGGGGFFGKLPFGKKPGRKFALLFIGTFLFLGLGLGFLAVLSGGGSTSPTGNVGIGTTNDLLSCKFGRAGDGEGNQISYKSPLLLSYIQEASSLSGIPPAVLAAFIRVETGGTLNKTDDQIQAMNASNCPENPVDGGLGIMQIQPPGTKSASGDPASCDECINAGAKFLGKTVSTLTREDYCNARQNVIIGAGWILKKLTYPTPLHPETYGDGTKWDSSWTNNRAFYDKLAEGYYGCENYGAGGPCNNPARIYSYGGDVYNSAQNCKPSTSNTSFPTTGSAVLDKIYATAEQITLTLGKGADGNFNARPGVGGIYQCTYLVIDSYNAAGLNEINTTNSAWVVNMKNFFNTTPGYRLAPPDTPVTSLRPGDVVIFEAYPGTTDNLLQHVSIVKSIVTESDGTGTITTFDANNYTINDKISVSGFQARQASGIPNYTISGFGQVASN